MTQEEKLKEAQRLYETANADQRYVLESLFPELVESKDERIRKELIKETKGSEERLFETVTNDEFVAWLERQGQTFTKKDVDDAYLKDISDTKNELERQAQKPAAWSEDDKRKIDRIYSILRQAADTHAFSTSCRLIGDKECIELQDFLKSLRPQSKQVLRDTFGYEDGRQFGKNEVLGNPEKYGLQRFAEWSKSDKEIVKEIDIIIHGTNSISDEVRKKLQDWLKSLRDRVQPQTKQEWSEEDETIIDSLLDVLYRIKKGKEPQATTRLIEQHINFIESLKERYAWKPSDEQIGIIAQSVAVLKVSGYDELGDRLGDISEQLNKLREE